MKKILAIFGILALFISCQTKMNFDQTLNSVNFEDSSANPEIEFIGLKTSDSKWTEVSKQEWSAISERQQIKNIGKTLQSQRIALDESQDYSGDFSSEGLKNYEGKKRFIAFAEIPDFDFKYSTNQWQTSRKVGLALIWWPIVGIPLLFLPPYKTKIELNLTYKICVFDSKTNSIVYEKPFTFKRFCEKEGLWDKTSAEGKAKVYDFYATDLSNGILKAFNNLKGIQF